MKSWKKIRSKVIHRNPWYSILENDVIWPNGKKGKYYLFKKDPGVVIIAYDGKKIYLVNQFRYSFQKRMWELPAGKTETKNALNNAKRELKEETGLEAERWTYLGYFACGPGHTNHIGKVFLAEKLRQRQTEREGQEIDMYVRKFSLSQIDSMIEKGEIIDSWMITPLYFFKQYLNKKK